MSTFNRFSKLLFSFVFLFLLIQIFSENPSFALKVKHSPKRGEIILSASSCETLKAEVNAVLLWTLARNENPPTVEIDCSQTPNFRSIDIAPLIPAFARDTYRKVFSCHGPNCYNTALMDQGHLSFSRHVYQGEWHNYLELHCKKRKQIESPQPGDAVSIRKKIDSDDYKEIHGFTFVGRFAFSKNGLSSKNVAKLQSFRNVLAAYGVETKKQCINPDIVPPQDCSIFLNYFSCEPTSDTESMEPFLEFESKLSRSTVNRDLRLIEQLKTELNQLRASLSGDSEDSFPLASRFLSYQAQLQELHFESTYDRLSHFHKITGVDLNRTYNILSQNFLDAAIARNDLRVVRKLLKEKTVNPNYQTLEGYWTPLTRAIEEGKLSIAKELIRNPRIDLNQIDAKGQTPLARAAETGQIEIVKKLLSSRQIDVNLGRIGSPLYFAARNGHLEIVKRLLEHDQIDVDRKNGDGIAPLLIAIEKNHLEVVRALVLSGADVHLNFRRVTPLSHALHNGYLEIAEFLREHGADIDHPIQK
jgi:ankyrin repeat protein